MSKRILAKQKLLRSEKSGQTPAFDPSQAVRSNLSLLNNFSAQKATTCGGHGMAAVVLCDINEDINERSSHWKRSENWKLKDIGRKFN